jgi:hypothetical protein
MSHSMPDDAPTTINHPGQDEVAPAMPEDFDPSLEELPEETVDAVPVLAEARPIEPAYPAARVTRTGPRRAVDLLPIVGSRTFLVDVHLIAKPQE